MRLPVVCERKLLMCAAGKTLQLTFLQLSVRNEVVHSLAWKTSIPKKYLSFVEIFVEDTRMCSHHLSESLPSDYYGNYSLNVTTISS